MVAEYERAKILERSRRGKRHKAQTGQVSVLSGAPYGYRYVNVHEGVGCARYEVIEEHAQVVKNIFNGMRSRDTTLMRAQFHSSATMRSAAYDRTAKAIIEEDGASEWITSVSGAPANLVLDERLGAPAVHVDGNLATVWVYYEFYAGENFSHCGADVFTFGRTAEGWKIVFVADSRRKTGCAKNLAKGS
jgi:hypothetical protein